MSDSSFRELNIFLFNFVLDVEDNIGVGFMIIRNIGDLLPKAFDAKIRYVTCTKCIESTFGYNF